MKVSVGDRAGLCAVAVAIICELSGIVSCASIMHITAISPDRTDMHAAMQACIPTYRYCTGVLSLGFFGSTFRLLSATWSISHGASVATRGAECPVIKPSAAHIFSMALKKEGWRCVGPVRAHKKGNFRPL